jgi:hypothetical protein
MLNFKKINKYETDTKCFENYNSSDVIKQCGVRPASARKNLLDGRVKL